MTEPAGDPSPATATVDVVLPVLDEAAAIPWVMSRWPDGYRAIVVDNGSTDGSDSVAREHGADVVYEEAKGFGAACYAGLVAASADIVCFMDCDASLDPRELDRVVGPVARDEADLVVGARRGPRGSFTIHGRAANLLLGRIASRRTGTKLTDIGPMRAARRQALLDLGLVDRRFGWPLEMVLRAGEAGWTIRETEITYHPRVGRSKITGTVRGTIRTARDMSKALR
ncbi:glycosyltransferase family 2 protein [Thermoleophilia bacterium SCSIO 60948]|nr:glycosyltransferase family 2 protein [Thermoleophilia bacterium SCSIO 60948]